MDEGKATPIDISTAAGANTLKVTLGGIVYQVGPVRLKDLVDLQTQAAEIPADRLARSWFELLSILLAVLIRASGSGAGISDGQVSTDWVQETVLASEVPALDAQLRPILLDALGNG